MKMIEVEFSLDSYKERIKFCLSCNNFLDCQGGCERTDCKKVIDCTEYRNRGVEDE